MRGRCAEDSAARRSRSAANNCGAKPATVACKLAMKDSNYLQPTRLACREGISTQLRVCLCFFRNAAWLSLPSAVERALL